MDKESLFLGPKDLNRVTSGTMEPKDFSFLLLDN